MVVVVVVADARFIIVHKKISTHQVPLPPSKT